LKALLNIFRNRLLDLSAANRSIFLPKTFKGKYADVMTWDFKSADSGLGIVKQLVSGISTVKIADVKHFKGEELETVLQEAKKILRTHQLILEETGSADFYVGWPFVEGVLKNDMPLRAPLAFFPYTLKIVGREIFLEKTAEGEAFWNRSLFLSLSLYESYQFDKDWLEQPITGIEDLVDQDFRVALINQLKENGWHPSFDRDFLAPNLTHFLPVNKEELTTRYGSGHYQLKAYAVMGLFPQSTSYIHTDYDALKKNTAEQTVEQTFAPFYKSNDLPSTSSLQFTPLPIDGSQENIITKVVDGQSLIVQGPPGSGKTQLICNLVAQFLGKGKKTLVVCQKKAALDVIHQRLESLDLAPFVALVHDAIGDKKEIFTKIEEQIACADDYKQKNIHPDTIVLEKEFSRIQSAVARLNAFFISYKEALYDTTVGGETVHALYLKSDKTFPVVDLTHEFRSIPADELTSKQADFEYYLFYYTALKSEFQILEGIHSNYSLAVDDKENLYHLLQNIETLNDTLHQWNSAEEYLQFIPLSYAKEWIANIEAWEKSSLIYRFTIPHHALKNIASHDVVRWEKQINVGFDLIKQERYTLGHEEVSTWRLWLSNNKTSALRRTLFLIKSKVQHKAFSTWFAMQGFDWSEKGFESAITQLHAIAGLIALESTWTVFPFIDAKEEKNRTGFLKQLEAWKQILQAREELFDIPALARLWQSHDGFKERLAVLYDILHSRDKALQAYYTFWSAAVVDRLFKEEAYKKSWILFLEHKFDVWIGFTQLKQNTDAALWRSFEKAVQTVASTNKEECIEMWNQSIMRCWIDEKERLSPILKTVSTPEFALKEEELQVLITRRYTISLEYLKIKLREWVYADITYNRLNRQVTYRDLNYQVTKKRSVWPLRKILAAHEEEVLTLLPCWLVSPETASTIFPLHDLFDVVIFDEASQCFVEKAFPSLFRGKQVVVIGDNKQLKPNDLYRVRYRSEDEEEEIDYEVESLLDFSNRYFPSQMLKGHYRSKSEQLIRFSNTHFYEGALRVIPDIAYSENAALHYVKVDGHWEYNTNRVEAEKVLSLVQEYLHTFPGKSIGIITFNYQQAFLIRELLESAIQDLPTDLMVKNIENVQGDERDIIIFSIAYAKNTAGKMITQFGSLSQDGGENRLNVAVTRAKEKVVLVSSIFPSDLQVEHHKNTGVQLLKAYMQYVYDLTYNTTKEEIGVLDDRKSVGLLSKIKTHFPERYSSTHFADLKDLKHSDRLLFADEKLYFFAPSVSDWHGYSKLMFKKKGWVISNVSTRNYWLDRAQFFNLLSI